MKKKLIKLAITLSMIIAFSVSSLATNTTIIVYGNRVVIQQYDHIDVYCEPPFNVICFGIVINNQGTFIVWDTGGNDPGIQVENDYTTTTGDDGTVHFSFQLVN